MINVELGSCGGVAEVEDSTIPMKTFSTGGAGVVVVLVVVVGRGCTVDLTEVRTVVRSIFGLESVVWGSCVWVRGVAPQSAVLLQNMIRLF